MNDGSTNLAIARQFAKALDDCDYTHAEEFLAEDCRYKRPGETELIGAGPILGAYRASDEKARREFESVRYRSEAVAADPAQIQLLFFDELRRGQHSHTFRCQQIVYVDDKQKIGRIDLVEIPGERERLREFCEKHAKPSSRK